MLLDYELAISCAFAALVILRIVHLRRKWRRVREQLNSITTATDDLRDTKRRKLTVEHTFQRKAGESWSPFADRLIIYLLVIALLWFGGRTWMQY